MSPEPDPLQDLDDLRERVRALEAELGATAPLVRIIQRLCANLTQQLQEELQALSRPIHQPVPRRAASCPPRKNEESGCYPLRPMKSTGITAVSGLSPEGKMEARSQAKRILQKLRHATPNAKPNG